MSPTPRERLIASAVALIGRNGVNATGLTELLEHSKTARGSIYQHFPDGKDQLIAEATLTVGSHLSKRVREYAETGSAQAILEKLIDDSQRVLESSNFLAGCPVVAAAQATSPAIRQASATVFDQWRDDLAAAFNAGGVDSNEMQLATIVLSAIEGAVIQCRSAQSATPLRDVQAMLAKLLPA